MNKVLETTKLIVDHSSFVSINRKKIFDFVNNFHFKDSGHWLDGVDFDWTPYNLEQKLNIILIFNALSFYYWGDPKWTIEYQRENYDGSFGMIKVIERALVEGYEITDWGYCEKISEKDFAHIMRGNVEIPFFQERLNIIRNIGKRIVEKYNGRLTNLLQRFNSDIHTALELIINNFPSFEDISFCDENEVYFLKRAQLLVADFHTLFPKLEYLQMKNIDLLTACADYKLPQILRKTGVLEYSSDLADKIDRKTIIEHDSQEEIEIRANTIWAVEYIKEELKNTREMELNSMKINEQLWLATQEKKKDDKPYHLTRTVCY